MHEESAAYANQESPRESIMFHRISLVFRPPVGMTSQRCLHLLLSDVLIDMSSGLGLRTESGRKDLSLMSVAEGPCSASE